MISTTRKVLSSTEEAVVNNRVTVIHMVTYDATVGDGVNEANSAQ